MSTVDTAVVVAVSVIITAEPGRPRVAAAVFMQALAAVTALVLGWTSRSVFAEPPFAARRSND